MAIDGTRPNIQMGEGVLFFLPFQRSLPLLIAFPFLSYSLLILSLLIFTFSFLPILVKGQPLGARMIIANGDLSLVGNY